MEDMGTESELLELAEVRFGKLTEVDKKLFAAVAKGEEADYSSKKDEENNPANADKWTAKRVIKAEQIQWLCTDREAKKHVRHKGMQVQGARIEGELDLDFVEMNFPLSFHKCAFDKTISLQYAQIRALYFVGTHTGSIVADGLVVEASVFLSDNFKAEGEVIFTGANIGGIFSCIKGKFINPGKKALSADRINVKGGVYLREGFRAEGEVRFPGANIDGVLDCTKGAFINLDKVALQVDRLNVKGGVFLNDGFKAEGEVRLPGAIIGGDLSCIKSEFINPGRRALSADGLNINGNVYLRDGFRAEGEVRLPGATIGGYLDCSGIPEKKTKGGEFINPGKIALFADRLNVKGDVFLRNGFKAEGNVQLLGATIGGSLSCTKGEFINPGKYALLADRLNVQGNVSFRKDFKAEGRVSLSGAMINRLFIWTDVDLPEKAGLDLRSAKIGTLWDEQKSWPDEGELYLHGLVYDNIYDKAPKDVKSRIEWLRLQGGDGFKPQPYEQLADVLKKSGHEETAKEILIAKNKDRIRSGPKLTKIEWWRYKFFGPMIGYGYRPWDVFWKGPFGIWFLFSILFWLVIGCMSFRAGYKNDLFSPTMGWAYDSSKVQINLNLKDQYPAFNFFVYSIDTFVPLVDLHQTKYWLPNPNKDSWQCTWKAGRIDLRWIRINFGGLLRLYLWLHISMGWILTTLLVVGFTGLIRT